MILFRTSRALKGLYTTLPQGVVFVEVNRVFGVFLNTRLAMRKPLLGRGRKPEATIHLHLTLVLTLSRTLRTEYAGGGALPYIRVRIRVNQGSQVRSGFCCNALSLQARSANQGSPRLTKAQGLQGCCGINALSLQGEVCTPRLTKAQRSARSANQGSKLRRSIDASGYDNMTIFYRNALMRAIDVPLLTVLG